MVYSYTDGIRAAHKRVPISSKEEKKRWIIKQEIIMFEYLSCYVCHINFVINFFFFDVCYVCAVVCFICVLKFKEGWRTRSDNSQRCRLFQQQMRWYLLFISVYFACIWLAVFVVVVVVCALLRWLVVMSVYLV